MNENEIESIEYKGYYIKVYTDADAQSPREDRDNLGHMICFHREYALGDKHDINSNLYHGWGEIRAHLKINRGAYIILPLYLYDHSGLRMKVGSFQGLLPQGHAEFDSGMVGFIYVTAAEIRKEYSVKHISKKTRDRAERVLRGEVLEYDDYLRGAVVGNIIEDRDGNNKDSCWGYYPEHNEGDGMRVGPRDWLNEDYGYMIDECKAIIDGYIKEDERIKRIQESVTTA